MVVLASQIIWTQRIQADVSVENVKRTYKWAEDVVLQWTTCEFPKELEYKRNILISELTHIKNATQQLLSAKDLKFEWQIQLKFALENGKQTDVSKMNFAQWSDAEAAQLSVHCLMGDTDLPYCFEYHGSDQRIVQTALTDFCYLIATQAISDKLGCAPQGRAGTGKTESAKALAIQLGRPVLVFNTDENFNEAAVGRILIGASEVGAMVIFDEFNRLEENTLSAVSSQLSQIQNGLRAGLHEIPNFLESKDKPTIKLNQNTAIFITMNPGYAGRRELPDTLKTLLRDVAMNQPDLFAIIEVMLSSNGFVNASQLSKKIVPLFELAKEQMSQ